MGAEVIAAASTQEKLDFCTDLGAHHTINYCRRRSSWSASRRSRAGAGIDVVYDPVGGDMSEAAFRSLKWNGRHLVIGFASGTIPKAAAQPAAPEGVQPRRRVLGSLCGERAGGERRERRGRCSRCSAMGDISPRITERFSLDDAAEALQVVAERRVVGTGARRDRLSRQVPRHHRRLELLHAADPSVVVLGLVAEVLQHLRVRAG